MKRILTIFLVIALVFLQFTPTSIMGANSSTAGWYLVNQEYKPIEKDGEEYPTLGLSGYVDYHGATYDKSLNTNTATIHSYRKSLDSGEVFGIVDDFIEWTDPLDYYPAQGIPSISITRSSIPADTNARKSHISAGYTKSSNSSYRHDEDFYNSAGEDYISNTTTILDLSKTSGYAGFSSGLLEGSLDNLNQLEIYVAFKTGNSEHAYGYSYYYEWMESNPNTSSSDSASLGQMNFTDLASSHWSYTYVEYMVNKGIIVGYEDGSFRPNASFSRAAFAKLLTLSFELNDYTGASVKYNDLPSNHWAYSYTMAAQDYLTFYQSDGINYFMPDKDAEREDVAVAVIKAMHIDKATADLTYLDKFTDKWEISEDLRPYIALAVEYGVMQGTGSDTFSPRKALTRAEACTLFARYLMEIKDTLNIDNLKKVTN